MVKPRKDRQLVSGKEVDSHESFISKRSFFSPSQAGSVAIAKAKNMGAKRMMRNIMREKFWDWRKEWMERGGEEERNELSLSKAPPC